jgi:hypothetical protein
MSTSEQLRNRDVIGELLDTLHRAGFWGSLTFKFERGEVVNIRKEENFKPSELSGHPRLNHEQQRQLQP